MKKFEGFSIYAENLKSFNSDYQGFDEILNINLIVGRNNSGKSSLIDLIEHAVRGDMIFPENHWHNRTAARIITQTNFCAEDAAFFPSNHSGGYIYGNHRDYGEAHIGSKIVTAVTGNRKGTLLSCDSKVAPALIDVLDYRSRIECSPNRNPLNGLRFHRLAAERNVLPEVDHPAIAIQSTGEGATNMIQHFINKSHLPSHLVERTLLNALNEIFAPDAVFTDIVCQHHSDNRWEIYLEEQHKGRIALSQSGSGLKTTILVLCQIHLLPTVLNTSLESFVFAFEELENNLHPALQRRLLNYIANRSIEHDFPVFLTTHSSVAIDMFSKRDDAQIIHITHNGKTALAKRVTTYVESRGILDDLDLRASDLLQANGIVWVEGPSDRIYLNKWIELLSGGRLKEGVHYQCIFYGGRLLSHLSAHSLDGEADGIPLLTVNRNAAILIDSDKRNVSDDINETKKRILREFRDVTGLTWVTSGREVENYIPDTVLQKWLPTNVPFRSQKNKYSSFFEHLNRIQSGLGDKYEGKKPLLAEQMAKLTRIDDLKNHVELYEKISDLCIAIYQWNKMPSDF